MLNIPVPGRTEIKIYSYNCSSKYTQAFLFLLCLGHDCTEMFYKPDICDMLGKVDKKGNAQAMLRNRYNRIPQPAPNTKWKHTTKTALSDNDKSCQFENVFLYPLQNI